MRFIHPITNFNSGELDNKLFGRIDVEEYRSGLSLTSNCLLSPQGSVYKRVGAKQRGLVGGVPDVQDVNILEFTLGDGTSVILEFVRTSFLYTMRLLSFDLINIPLTYEYSPFIGTSPELVPNWNGVAIGKKIYVTNYLGTVSPFVIDLTDMSTPKVQAMPLQAFKGAPFLEPNNDPTKRMRITNANQGPGSLFTIEADFNAFTPDHTDSQLMITGITKYTQIVDVDENTYTFNRLGSTIFLITQYVSPTQVRGYAYHLYLNGLSLANVSGTRQTFAPVTEWFDEWRFSAWSREVGFPKLFSAFEGRLIVCGTPSNPDRIFASKINDPYVFQDNRYPMPESQSFSYFVITAENSGDLLKGPEGNTHTHTWKWDTYNGSIEIQDPYQFSIASKDSAAITWLESSRFGVIGTFNKQYFLDGDGTVVSQTNISIRPFATKSSSPLKAIAVDNTVFYTDSTGTKVYMYLYNESNGSYISKEVTLLYGKFKKDDYIVNMKYSREFGAILFFTLKGNCVALTYSQETSTLGFTNFFSSTENVKIVDYVSLSTPDYKDIGVACIKIPNGNMHYFTFSSDIMLGLLDPVLHSRVDELNYLDRLFSYYEEPPSDTVLFMDFFGEETLIIYATDGVDVIDIYEIEHDGSSTITLPKNIYTGFAVGAKYAFEIATMPIEAGQSYATAQMGQKRIDQALIRTSDCTQVKVGTDGYNYELVPVSDNRAVFEMIGNPEFDHIVYIRHDDIGPCRINNITLRGVNNDA